MGIAASASQTTLGGARYAGGVPPIARPGSSLRTSAARRSWSAWRGSGAVPRWELTRCRKSAARRG
eukprot:3463470-Alexandrium_andersonii.AAC.1